MAARRTLCLVRQKRILYPKSLSDYELLCSLGVPFYKLDADYLASLRSRLTCKKVGLEIVSYEEIVQSMLSLIQSSWEFGFAEMAAGSFKLTVPNKRSARARAQKLVDALKSFYRRHLSVLEIQVRKGQKSTTLKFTAVFDKDRNPEWLTFSRSS
jgi:hypothetical protein